MVRSHVRRPCLAGRSAVLLSLASMLLGGTPRAGEITTNLSGEVLSVLASLNPDAVSQLAALGVEVGSPVTAHVTIESTTAGVPLPGPPHDFVQYDLAVTDMSIVIGSWEAHIDPKSIFASVNFVQVADNASASGFEFDSWSAVAQGLDTDDILSAGTPLTFGNFFFGFTQLPPNASSDDGLVQDLSKYKSSRLGTFAGPGGVVTVVFDGQGGGGTKPPPDPTALARKGQLRAAGWLGKKLLKGLGKLAGKPPEFDPLGAQEVALLQDCEDTFGLKFLKAVDKALEKGGTAPLPASGKDAATDFLMTGFLVQADALTAGGNPDDPADRALRAKLLKAAAAQLGADFGAYAKHAKKPDADKLAKALAKSRATLAKTFGKALDAAEKAGVTYAGPMATQVSDALLALVQGFDDMTKGP